MCNTKHFLTLLMGFFCAAVWAENAETTSITQTTTIISKTVVTKTKQSSYTKTKPGVDQRQAS